MTEREQLDTETGEKFATEFSTFVNRMGGDGVRKAAIAKMMREHRTLQQNTMRFCMEYIEAQAEQSHDLRNEASVKLAKTIMHATREVRHLPFI